MDSFPTGQLTKGYRPDPQIYIQLIQECENQRKEGEFSPCFTELQRDFLKNRPPKLKSLIRLVKHWYQQVWPVPSGQRAEEEEDPHSWPVDAETLGSTFSWLSVMVRCAGWRDLETGE